MPRAAGWVVGRDGRWTDISHPYSLCGNVWAALYRRLRFVRNNARTSGAGGVRSRITLDELCRSRYYQAGAAHVQVGALIRQTRWEAASFIRW